MVFQSFTACLYDEGIYASLKAFAVPGIVMHRQAMIRQAGWCVLIFWQLRTHSALASKSIR
jgi:hypothetical protein